MINVALGGSLILNFPKDIGEEHVNGGDHMVNAVPGSLVHKLFGDRFEVNSYHRNTIDRLAEGLVVTSRSDKGVIDRLNMNPFRCLDINGIRNGRAGSSGPESVPRSGYDAGF